MSQNVNKTTNIQVLFYLLHFKVLINVIKGCIGSGILGLPILYNDVFY